MIASIAVNAQGIKFEHGTFAEALAKAKKENKLLFVDFYTSWCGPCKMMSKKIFPTPEVGEYFNDKFISLKIDAEKGEGPELAKKYEVKGFPTMIFFNGDGSENKRLVGGTPDATFFISFAKQVTGDETPFLEQFEVYKKGNRNLDFVRGLIQSGSVYASTLPREEQRPWFEKFADMASWYFVCKQPHEMMNKEDFRLIATYLDGANNGNPFVEHIYNNYEAWKKVIALEDLSMFIQRTNNQSIHASYKAGNLKFREYLAAIHGRLAPLYKDDKNANGDDTFKVMTFVAEAGYCLHGLKDVDGYLDWQEKYKAYQKEKGELDARSYMALVGNCLHASKEYITEKQVKRLMGFINEGLKLDPKTTALISDKGDCYALLKNKKKAIECYNKVIELTKGGRGEDYYKENMTKKIQALK
jgi:thiol-disulfide isomerase/thioredoxin